ncbi:hypothetical protein MC7420_357 [Coleofasciculus chthonoplastes PCC 7420]|uniref:Uncharacterized protein n=1 Tax=Coleofasciculus chthonoplastes PCC 7420 TaxID=118168 RepID=B4VLT8_9CYAN|nr:hypothetical protein [Coleofasciculus chthonoplastes]EDX77220.1 hypothetical protein MC7420_357 [Coleofasciculus chthonoplastes PCC 7420]
MDANTKPSNSIMNLIDERTRIWQKYDQTQQLATELNNFSYFNNPSVKKKLPLLSASQSPPDELAVALEQIRQDAQKIKTMESNIRKYQSEIEANKKQFFMVVGGAIVALILVLFLMLNR